MDRVAFEQAFAPLFEPVDRARAERDDTTAKLRRALRRLDQLDQRMEGLLRAAREEALVDTAALVLALADADPGTDPIEVVSEWLRARGNC